MLKVAMLSKWHVHADGYAHELKRTPGVQLTAVWDEEPERGKEWAQQLGADFEADLDKLLKRDDVDAVCVCTPTNMHKKVMIAAAKAGKHIYTEKVMAFNVKDCEEIAQAVKENNVKFCISFPHRTRRDLLFAKKVVEEKLVGDVTLIRIRNAHTGASDNWLPDYFYDEKLTGGGAMMDLGAHGMYLSRWLLGTPVKITSMFNSFTGKPVEDNAVSVIEFENKAIAITETGFVSPSPFYMEINGTQGHLFIGGPDNVIKLASRNIKTDVPGWITPTQLPKELPSAIDQWVGAITNGTPIYFGLDEAIQLTELMQGAYQSAKTGKVVTFPLK